MNIKMTKVSDLKDFIKEAYPELNADGVSIKLLSIKGEWVDLEFSFTKNGRPLVFWKVEHLYQGEVWELSGCDIIMPCELADG